MPDDTSSLRKLRKFCLPSRGISDYRAQGNSAYRPAEKLLTSLQVKELAVLTQYEDRFIDQQTFSWMTRSNLTLSSEQVMQIAEADENGLDVRLFIKKHDSEGADFYYMGRVHPRNPRQMSIMNDRGEELPIVNFVLDLEQPVRTDIYEYFAEA